MTPRQKRMSAIAAILVGLGLAAFLLLTAFEKNLMYFYTPTEVANGEAPRDRKFRIGGMVVENSVVRAEDSLAVQFALTDTANIVTVRYEGILPDLFREGQGIVANGTLDAAGNFIAAEVLAKHDENYMPPEVAEALEQANADGNANKMPLSN
ncbi:MAG: cytochrome c maturation protein CcmE [Pseudomonadota bacterium]